MILKKILIKLIKFYKYFSPLFGNKCRYYPTCSTYSLWLIENDNILKAIFKSFFRILRCNQLFKGGIEYPKIKKQIKNIKYIKKGVKYWLIPTNKKNYYYVIKANNDGK
ncbi:membrane protein insertion efficiency factor YidD [Caminibacter mediatlanticus TB-2]|uniref:Putative membrane protein insertion efficiency factor n=1 Tax=Caminibacter mediatlanticus TB-2 TaxID=391592 RepID=A0AAI9AIN5_9BACT|nr:membrane protein insertion efficiency factor YidD [Caminibacter mediatlanticus]EDM24240.1 hypothetical protein CMTB2_01953 [Caminibacter mediatlanticus TB-2]QCT94886.1 membrane protein insertion efficiency factor YidD [Caminibacter mediatlanticus TB-2]